MERACSAESACVLGKAHEASCLVQTDGPALASAIPRDDRKPHEVGGSGCERAAQDLKERLDRCGVSNAMSVETLCANWHVTSLRTAAKHSSCDELDREF
jgi:hypothetical protein